MAFGIVVLWDPRSKPWKTPEVMTNWRLALWTRDQKKGGPPMQEHYLLKYIQHICCRVENPSKNCPFLSWKSVQIFPFFLFLFLLFKNIILSAGRMRLLKKIKEKQKEQKKTIVCVENPSNYVAQHTWTDFQRNLGRIFNSTILLMLGLCFLFEKVPKPLFL